MAKPVDPSKTQLSTRDGGTLGSGSGPGLGGMVSTLFGSTNNYRQGAPEVDANAYQYGGQAGGAQAAANRYRTQAEQAQNRQGVQVDYGQANQDRNLQMQARRGQAGLAQAMNARAMGLTPSLAQMQADRQMGQATAAQASAANSARGAAGIAMAQQNAANNTANAHSAISNQAQMNAVNERMQAEQAAMGAYSNMRGQDLGSQAQSAGQAQFQAQLQDAQRGRNDAMTMGMTQNEMGVNNTQLAAQMNQQAQQSSNVLGAGQINAAIAAQNAQINQQNAQGVMGAVSNLAGGIAGAFADGGKMKGAAPKPYLVGERGPELVVPKKDGFVIPAELTAKLLAGRRENGGDVNAPTSTWGIGRGQTESMTESDNWKRAQEIAQAGIDQRELDNRLATSGGMAVPGGAGSGVTADEPLRRADYETAALAKAKQAEGIELSPEEERKAAGAEHRQGVLKKNDRKVSLANIMSSGGKAGDGWQQQAAAVDTSYHGPTAGYVPPHLIQISGFRANGGPIQPGGETGPGQILSFGPMGGGASTPFLGGGQSVVNPQGHGSALGRLAIAHDLPSMSDVNKSTFRKPGPAAMMAPGAGVATHGYGVGSANARAEGGPVTGNDNWEPMPLYEPPGKMLQSTPEGRPYYVDEPTQSSGASLAKVMAPQPKESPVAARTPVALPPSQTKPRKMTDDELMAWANKLQGQMQSQHDQRMAQGPAVSLSSRMGKR